MIGIAYVRVSTEKQDEEHQKHSIESFAVSHGIKIVKWYVDHAISGVKDPLKRPGFKQLYEDVKFNKINPRPSILLVYETSRLARSIKQLIKVWDIVENELGLLIVSVNAKESFLWALDPGTRAIIRTIFGWLAELEREMIRERVKSALQTPQIREKFEERVLRQWKKEISDELRRNVVNDWLRGLSYRAIAEKYNISVRYVRKILLEEGVLNYVNRCPRCFSKLEEKGVKYDATQNKLVKILKCVSCNYEVVVSE